MIADKPEVARQSVVVDELPAVGEYRDVPVGQRCPGVNRAAWQLRGERERIALRVGVSAGNRGRPSQCQQVRERRALRPAVPEHLAVEPVDNVILLAEQQRTVAASHRSRVAVAAAGVDLLPGRERGKVDDARAVELFQLRQATGEVGLMHGGLVLEDLLLHGEKHRLVETQITRGVVGQPPRRPPKHRDHRLAHRIGHEPKVGEPGVEGRADHARHASPQQKGVLQEQAAVVAVDSLHDPPVLRHATTRAPAFVLDTRPLQRPVEPGLLQLKRPHATTLRPNPARPGNAPAPQLHGGVQAAGYRHGGVSAARRRRRKSRSAALSLRSIAAS
jgi:hypothetical protein